MKIATQIEERRQKMMERPIWAKIPPDVKRQIEERRQILMERPIWAKLPPKDTTWKPIPAVEQPIGDRDTNWRPPLVSVQIAKPIVSDPVHLRYELDRPWERRPPTARRQNRNRKSRKELSVDLTGIRVKGAKRFLGF
jgi:hypothetical protein